MSEPIKNREEIAQLIVEGALFIIGIALVCWNDWQLGLGIIILTGRLSSRLTKIQEKLKIP